MRLGSICVMLGLGLACEADRSGPPVTDEVILHACVWSVSSDTPQVEVLFGLTFDLDCQIAPRSSCEVVLEGDRLVVTGVASRRDASGYCAGNEYPMGASCPLPAGWEAATVLDWGTGASEPVEPPIVGLGQGANAGCATPCRVGEGGTLCD